MNILKIAAFAYNNKGGNPAGVVICDEMPAEKEMLEIAKQVGYSESAFLKPLHDGWRIRYFSPEIEIPFCGHATIASGAALGIQLAHPEWSPNFDFDPALSAETRKHFLDSHCETDTVVLTAHFPSPSVGLVVPGIERAFGFEYL